MSVASRPKKDDSARLGAEDVDVRRQVTCIGSIATAGHSGIAFRFLMKFRMSFRPAHVYVPVSKLVIAADEYKCESFRYHFCAHCAQEFSTMRRNDSTRAAHAFCASAVVNGDSCYADELRGGRSD